MRSLDCSHRGWKISGLLFALGSLSLVLAGVPAVAQESPPPTGSAPQTEKKASTKQARKARNLRDPFRSLLVRPEDAGPQALPPGKRGLVISQLSVDGIVVTPTARVAVVNMRGRDRSFFLRVRDQLYDGSVLEIREGSVVFRERATDAFGRRYTRRVVKQLSSDSSGTTR